jgi:hypothetical protein
VAVGARQDREAEDKVAEYREIGEAMVEEAEMTGGTRFEARIAARSLRTTRVVT